MLAGGSGSRVGAAINKAFLPLGQRPVAAWSLFAMAQVEGIGPLVFVVRPEDRERAEQIAAQELPEVSVEIITGGADRQSSELNALRHLSARIHAGSVDTVLIHDAARPLVSASLIDSVLSAARASGGAVPGFPAEDCAVLDFEQDPGVKDQGAQDPGAGAHAVRRLAAGEPPQQLLRVQTPQGFRAGPLLDAYEAAARDGFAGTDTASCVEAYTDLPVQWVAGDAANFKITFPQDVALAERLISAR